MKKNLIARIVSILFLIFIGVSSLGPVLVQAAGASAATGYTGTYCTGFTGTVKTGGNISDLIQFFTCIIQVSIIPLIVAIGVILFVYGVVKFIGTDQPAEREQGKQFMIWGIVGLAVIFFVWGLVQILGDTFGVRNVIPQLPVNPN